VIELVDDYTTTLTFGKLLKELWIVKELILHSFTVKTNSSSRNRIGGNLLDATRKSSKERLILEQTSNINIEIVRHNITCEVEG
jgi:hypothetical protein